MIEYAINNYDPSDQGDLVGFFRMALGKLGFDFDLDAKDQDLRHIPAIY